MIGGRDASKRPIETMKKQHIPTITQVKERLKQEALRLLPFAEANAMDKVDRDIIASAIELMERPKTTNLRDYQFSHDIIRNYAERF